MCCRAPKKFYNGKEALIMENENRIPLTRLEACTLMAREAVSLLEGGAEALNSGEELREALALLHSSQDLGDGGALLAWVDVELESARRFAKTGERTKSLVKLDTPLPLPGPAMQLDAVCEILKAAAQTPCTQEEWKAALNAARMLTEMDGLEDMVLNGKTPDGGSLTAEALRYQLRSVQAALAQKRGPSGAEQEMIMTDDSKKAPPKDDGCARDALVKMMSIRGGGRFQVITYSDDGGEDEKKDYASMAKAVRDARDYIRGKEGLVYEGALVYDKVERRIVWQFGFFPESALPR